MSFSTKRTLRLQIYVEPSEISEYEKNRAIDKLVKDAKDSLYYTPEFCNRAAEIIKSNAGLIDTSDIDYHLIN